MEISLTVINDLINRSRPDVSLEVSNISLDKVMNEKSLAENSVKFLIETRIVGKFWYLQVLFINKSCRKIQGF